MLTSRNVRGHWLTDAALGGLNYQIEHHLFPSMPRPNLRHSQALIRDFCQQRDLPYCESSLVGSYAQALRHLNSVGRSARPGTSASSGAHGQPAVCTRADGAAGSQNSNDYSDHDPVNVADDERQSCADCD